MSFGHWLCTHKFLLFLVASTTAFCLATIILSVDNAELRDKIDDFEKNATITVPTTTTTRTTTITTTTPVATTSTTTTTTVIPVETTTSTAKTTFESPTITSFLTTTISPITTVPPEETTTIIPVTSTTEEPTTTTTEEIPTSTTEEITTIEHSTTSEVPLTSTTEESTTSEIPSTSTTEEPTTTTTEEIPTSTTEEITTIEESTTSEVPSTSTTEESTTSEVPSTSTAEESTTELTTSTTEELTTTTQEITTSTTEQSTTIEDSTISPPTTTEDPDSDNMWVLPKATRPVAYELTLLPHLGSGLFDGKVKIQVDVAESIESISLHSHLLEISSVTVDGVDANFELNEDYQLLVITKQHGNRFDAERIELEIDYSGDMKNGMVGLYTSSYLNDDGDTTVIATSKFEPTYARQAFPCFDEPNKKATYVVKLLKPKATEYIALSNYPIENTEEYDDNNELVTFNETVPMSTYLTCFIVSDFTATETTFNNGEGKDPIPLKVYASSGQLSKTQYAGEIGKAAIEYYVNYFGIPYPLPKLDMVAIPDFVSGAMEHWGLVTYRETALLYTAETHSSSNKQRVATVVAHELAHSWFGNLVTMNWWNDLWLNEGFATYIEYKGVAAHHPDWDMMTQFLTADLHPVLAFDAEVSSYPIVTKVTTPDEITSVFNTIAYNKGASILRMLEDTVGEENFRTGVTNYLKAHQFGNAVTKEFLNEVQAVVGDEFDIIEIMDTYTTQKGYPVVSVTADEGDTTWTLTQKRFLKNSIAVDPDAGKYEYKWTIPITWRASDGTTTTPGRTVFKYSDASVNVKIPSSATYVKFNSDQVGYYRVHYPDWVYSRLVANYETLTVADRTNIIEEWFALADANVLSPFYVPLELTKKLVTEVDYAPWSAAASVLLKLKIRMREDTDTTHVDNLKAYLRSLIRTPYENITWIENENDSHLRRLTRNVVVQLACEAELEDCTQEAQNLFNDWIESNTPLSQDLRSIVYKYGIKRVDEDSWNIVFDRFKAEPDANEKLKLMNGLANIENTEILTRFIKESENTTIVRTQDFLTLLQYVSGNEYGTSLVWEWVRENWKFLVDRYSLNDRNLGSLIPSITSSFDSMERLTEMNKFFADNPEAGAGATNRQKALETVQNNYLWATQKKNLISSWFKNNTL